MDGPRTNLRRPGRLPLIVALVAASAAAGAYVLLRHRGGTELPGPDADAAAAPAPAAPSPPSAAAPEPALDEGAAKPLLEGISGDPGFRRWIDAPGAARRVAILVANVAENVSPRRALAPLAPASPFSVERRGGRLVIASDSYSRYDAVAGLVASIDVQVLATAYRHLHASLEAAYRALGYPAGSLDRLTARALGRIESAPVADGDVPVAHREGAWVFVDPRLERLGDVEKHLLRMGPRNQRIVQGKARELREALRVEVASGR